MKDTATKSRKAAQIIVDNRTPQEIAEINWLINACKVLLHKATCMNFVDLLIVPEIAERKDVNPRYVMVKVSHPISGDMITSPKEPIRHPLCRVHHLHSASLHFGYIIAINSDDVTVRKNYVSIIRTSAIDVSKFTNVAMRAQDAALSIFYSEDGACLVCFSEHFDNLPADILKGSMT
jgi:hypothetical protein